MRQKKLYVLSDATLPLGDQGAQSVHAAIAWAKENGFHQWDNETLVIATVPDQRRLEMLTRKLDSRMIAYSSFREPDLDGRLTAIACLTDSNIFDNYKLMGAAN